MKKNNMKYRFSEFVRGKTVSHEWDIQALYKHCVRKAWQPIRGQNTKPKLSMSSLTWRKQRPENG